MYRIYNAGWIDGWIDNDVVDGRNPANQLIWICNIQVFTGFFYIFQVVIAGFLSIHSRSIDEWIGG